MEFYFRSTDLNEQACTMPDCRCVLCKFPPAKRPRRLSSAPAAISNLTPLGVAPDFPRTALEPTFLLERLAHIRCLSLTVCGANGRLLRKVEAFVSGSEVELKCLQRADETGALHEIDGSVNLSDVWSYIRLDVGKEIAPSSAAVQLIDGYAYLKLPLVSSTLSTELDGGLGCKAERTYRAAEQRRCERQWLRGSQPRCRKCAALICSLNGNVRALPDVDAAAMVDFVQCCEELSFSWNCLFPPSVQSGPQALMAGNQGDKSARAESIICFMGNHSLLLCSELLPSTHRCPSKAFYEPRSYRHDFLQQHVPVSVWDPICCTQCSTILGAARRPAADAVHASSRDVRAGMNGNTISEPSVAPVWFERRCPPQLDCTLQLLKCRISLRGTLPASGGCEVFAGEQVHLPRLSARSWPEQLSDANNIFSPYSMAGIIAAEILRAVDEEEDDEDTGSHGSDMILQSKLAREDSRHFVIGPTQSDPLLQLTLLSQHGAIHTNHPWAGCTSNNTILDAIKILFTKEIQCAHAQLPLRPPRWFALSTEECQHLHQLLLLSSSMLPPTLRLLGKLTVGFLPVAPTWE